ncbi:UPF0598 protein C8orf82 homolog [Takifugu flavidus]|uniref:UPF0598 protein C8orf82 homolog n=1 Tax=Takifugu flavidus TaxID=433684 RepID=UPI00254481C0|nr:UPF0598 protein C8orf82 homolog [Takifugu flavidus]
MFAVCGSCRTMFALRLWVLRCSAGSRTAAQYVQGQSPEPRIREYFYYLDHQGQLFLDDTKVKNFVTCFKDKQFLVFFFHRLRSNRSGRYQEDFPYVSLCGRERNFLRCDDRPVVFTHLLPGQSGDPALLSYCGGAEKLAVAFRPEALFMHPISGRVYHPCSEQRGGVGLVRSALAMELSPSFAYDGDAETEQPTHFQWGGQRHRLTNELSERFSSQ